MKKIFFIFILSIFGFYLGAEDFKYPYNALTERDPLRPLINERGEILIKDKNDMGDLFLQGVIYSPQGGTAIINNEMFVEGDMIGVYKVKRIEAKGVFLEKDGEDLYLKWEE